MDPALEDQAVPPRFWQEFDISKEEVIEVFCMFLLTSLIIIVCVLGSNFNMRSFF